MNGEYQDNVQAGPSGIARSGANDEWSTNGIVHRPFENTTTVGDRTFVGMNNISQYLSENTTTIRDVIRDILWKPLLTRSWAVWTGTSTTTTRLISVSPIPIPSILPTLPLPPPV